MVPEEDCRFRSGNGGFLRFLRDRCVPVCDREMCRVQGLQDAYVGVIRVSPLRGELKLDILQWRDITVDRHHLLSLLGIVRY